MPNSHFAQAAFRHQATGVVVPTGAFHDITQLPCGGENLEQYDQGFVNYAGAFFTRDQAHVAVPEAKFQHDGKILHSQDLFRKIELTLAKSVKDYTFENPTLEGHLYSVKVRHRDGKQAGQLTFHARAVTDPKSPHFGYHKIDQADVALGHRKQGLYGRLLQLGSSFVRHNLKSKGLVSEGQWRSEAATGAWQKLAQKKPIQSMPGVEAGSPDFRMNELDELPKLGTNDFEHQKHEFLIALGQWLKRKSLSKNEDLQGIFGSNLSYVTDDEHGIASRMLGQSAEDIPEFRAARFLSNTTQISPENLRLALLCYEHDLEMAALFAYGLPRNDENRAALKSLLTVQELSKGEIEVAAIPRLVSAAFPDGVPCADAVRRAFAAGSVHPVKLGGKHSKGTAIAIDPKTQERWLLKPGSGLRSPSAGMAEQIATQSRCEVAFSHVARLIGLQAVPEAELLLIDGQEVACLELIDPSYKTLNQLRKDPAFNKQAIFEPYRKSGELFRWAVLDMICGNVDRHQGNILISPKGDVKLIDHGSTFSGFGLSANDDKSFIPAYLRAWSNYNFLPMDPQARFNTMPRPDRSTGLAVSDWIDQIPLPAIVQILLQYGVLHDAVVARITALRTIRREDRVEWLLGFWSGITPI